MLGALRPPSVRIETIGREETIFMKIAGIAIVVLLTAGAAHHASADARVPGFAPSTSGLHFSNAWPTEPDVTINFLGFSIPIGNAAQGLCGGMVYTVRDFFESGYHIPLDTANPASGAVQLHLQPPDRQLRSPGRRRALLHLARTVDLRRRPRTDDRG
jgi:hypothetical protein